MIDYTEEEGELFIKAMEYKKIEKFRKLKKQVELYEAMGEIEKAVPRKHLTEKVRFTVDQRLSTLFVV